MPFRATFAVLSLFNKHLFCQRRLCCEKARKSLSRRAANATFAHSSPVLRRAKVDSHNNSNKQQMTFLSSIQSFFAAIVKLVEIVVAMGGFR